MFNKILIILFLSDSLFPTISYFKGFFLGKYVIINGINRMYIKNKYVDNSILSSKINLIIINKGYIFNIINIVLYYLIKKIYSKNNDRNIYYLNNINKYNHYNNCLYKWIKIGYYTGQLIYYNKNK